MKIRCFNLIFALLIIAFILPFMAGCKSLSLTAAQHSICHDGPAGQGSVICAIARELDIAPESISSIIKVGNLSAIASNIYTAQEAMEFINEVEVFLRDAQKKRLTYTALVRVAIAKYLSLPPETQALFIVLGDFSKVPDAQAKQILTGYDYSILFDGLEEQKRIIRPFLIE